MTEASGETMTGARSFKAWANVYRSLNGAMGSVYASRELADQQAAYGRLACVEIEFEVLEDK